MAHTITRALQVRAASALVVGLGALTLACTDTQVPATSGGSSGGGAASAGSPSGGSTSGLGGAPGLGGQLSAGGSAGAAGSIALGGGGAGGAGGTAGGVGASGGGNGGSGGQVIPVPGMGMFDQTVIDGLKEAVTHLYTFDGAGDTVTDSKGDVDGTVLGWAGAAAPAGVQASGDLSFSNNNAYVDLGEGFLTEASAAADAVSIEAFLTVTQHVPFARLYDFGTQDPDADAKPKTYVFLAPNDGLQAKIVSKGLDGLENGMVSQRPFPPGQMVHVVVTYEAKTFVDGAPDNKTEVFLWINGEAVVAGRWTGVLSELQDDNCWLNHSQFPDGGLNAKLHEFRVYDTVLTQQQIQNSFNAGIDALNP